MKKLGYLFLALALGVGVSSCNKSDNEGSSEILGTVVNISMFDDEGLAKLTSSIAYPKFNNVAGERPTTFSYYFLVDGKDKHVEFKAAYTAGACTVKYFDEVNGENIEVRYVLNADGFPASAECFYMSDKSKFRHYTFTYENKMLVEAVEDLDPDNATMVFAATYSNSDFLTLSAVGEMVDITSGTTLNNFGLDPNYMLAFMGMAPQDDAVSLAACLNMLPHAKHMPSALTLGDVSIDITQTVEQGSLVNYTVKQILSVDFIYLY